MFKKMSLGQKIILFSCVILFICFAIISRFALKKMYNYSENQANDVAYFTTKYNSKVFEHYFDKIKTLGESIANQSETLVQQGNPSRDTVISTLKNTLDTYDDYIFGITIAYEPNKFDNNDSSNIGVKGSSSKGEFTPYVTRIENNDYWIESAFAPNASDEQNKWYFEPKKSKKVYLTEPTTYTVQGKSVTMASVAVPIIRDNEFIGVVSIDACLDSLQNKISKDKPLGGFSEVVSTNGLYVASGEDNSKVMTHISQYDNSHPLLSSSYKGNSFSQVYTEPKSNEKFLEVYNPIHIDGSNQHWTYISIIPFSNIFKDFNTYFKYVLYACLLILAFIIYINYWIISRNL